jgi:hypothetical protein
MKAKWGWIRYKIAVWLHRTMPWLKGKPWDFTVKGGELSWKYYRLHTFVKWDDE